MCKKNAFFHIFFWLPDSLTDELQNINTVLANLIFQYFKEEGDALGHPYKLVPPALVQSTDYGKMQPSHLKSWL